MPAAHEPAGSFPPVADDQLNVSIAPPSREPVVVRGKAYYNTAAPEQQSAQEQKAAEELDVEGLVMRLAHDSRTENRKSAAEALRQLGPAATAAIPALLEVVTQTDLGVRQAALKR